MLQQAFKGLVGVKQHAVREHSAVVVGQYIDGRACRNELQAAANRGLVVDAVTDSVLLREEDRLVTGDRMRERPVGESTGRDSGIVQSCEVVPVPGEALAALPFLSAIDVDGGSLAFSQNVRSANMAGGRACGNRRV